MEGVAHPALSISPSAADYINRVLPPIPQMIQDQDMQNHYANRAKANGDSYSTTEDMQIDADAIADTRPGFHGKSNSSPGTFPVFLPRPPKPPMTKSNQKVLQLTGHDMRYDRALVEEPSEFIVSGDSSSSGSVYSQDGNRPGILERNISSFSAPVPEESRQMYLNSSIYTTSDKSTAPSSMIPIKAKGSKISMEDGEPQAIPQFRKGIGRTYSTEPVTILDFIDETQSHFSIGYEKNFGARYSHGMTDPNMTPLVPAALVLQPKSKKEPSNPDTRRNSIFANARDSMKWGIKGLTGGPSRRSKEPAVHVSFGMPPPISTGKKIFSSGKHPLKSPFPFYKSRKGSYSEESESKLSKTLSGAMKRLSGGKFPPPKMTIIIPNSARAANGPDTPIPVKSEFMTDVDIGGTVHHANEHLAEVYARAKKSLKIKTGDEKRRESLKKKIVVVGITDQSPDGRLAEWL